MGSGSGIEPIGMIKLYALNPGVVDCSLCLASYELSCSDNSMKTLHSARGVAWGLEGRGLWLFCLSGSYFLSHSIFVFGYMNFCF